MNSWTSSELERIEKTDELEIRTLRKDGSLSDPVTIWVNRIGDDIYIRAYKGRKGFWFRGAIDQHKGRIKCGGVEKDVSIIEVTSPEIIRQVDRAYLTKYREYEKEIVAPMVTEQARAATLKIIPAEI